MRKLPRTIIEITGTTLKRDPYEDPIFSSLPYRVSSLSNLCLFVLGVFWLTVVVTLSFFVLCRVVSLRRGLSTVFVGAKGSPRDQ